MHEHFTRLAVKKKLLSKDKNNSTEKIKNRQKLAKTENMATSIPLEILLANMPIFDGEKNAKLRNFLNEFDNLFKATEVADTLQHMLVRAKIKGPAREKLNDIDELKDERDYEIFKQKLLKHFDIKTPFPEAQEQFMKFKQKPHQSIKEFAENFEKLAKIYLESSSHKGKEGAEDFLDSLKLTQFLTAIRPDISFEVKKRAPNNYQKALKLARQIESALNSQEEDINLITQHPKKNESEEYQTLIEINKIQREEINRITKKLKELECREINSIETNIQDNPHKMPTKMTKQTIDRPKCKICKKNNHTTENCWYNKNKYENYMQPPNDWHPAPYQPPNHYYEPPNYPYQPFDYQYQPPIFQNPPNYYQNVRGYFNKPRCNICKKNNHSTKKCWFNQNVYNTSYRGNFMDPREHHYQNYVPPTFYQNQQFPISYRELNQPNMQRYNYPQGNHYQPHFHKNTYRQNFNYANKRIRNEYKPYKDKFSRKKTNEKNSKHHKNLRFSPQCEFINTLHLENEPYEELSLINNEQAFSIEDIKTEQHEDQKLIKIMENIKENKNKHKNTQYTLNEDEMLILKKETNSNIPLNYPTIFIAPETLRNQIISAAYAEHSDFRKTYQEIKRKFYWIGMYPEIKKYCAECY